MTIYRNVTVLQQKLIEEGEVTVPDFYRERETVIDYINYPDERILDEAHNNHNSIETIKGKIFFRWLFICPLWPLYNRVFV